MKTLATIVYWTCQFMASIVAAIFVASIAFLIFLGFFDKEFRHISIIVTVLLASVGFVALWGWSDNARKK